MIPKIFKSKEEKRELKEISKQIALENEIMEKLAQYQKKNPEVLNLWRAWRDDVQVLIGFEPNYLSSNNRNSMIIKKIKKSSRTTPSSINSYPTAELIIVSVFKICMPNATRTMQVINNTNNPIISAINPSLIFLTPVYKSILTTLNILRLISQLSGMPSQYQKGNPMPH